VNRYEIGDVVMTSTHRGQEVRYGRRKKDQLDVVIKIRDKRISFKDNEDINGWKRSMELL